jgi:hypothetical protein
VLILHAVLCPASVPPTYLVVTEAQLQAAVIDLAHACGYRVAHFRPARLSDGNWRTPVQGDGAGFPDCFIVKKGRAIAAELKSERGRLTPAQSAWLEALASAGIEVYVWRPSHWHLGEIANILTRKAARA